MSPRRREIFRAGKRGALVRVVAAEHRGIAVWRVEYRLHGARKAAQYPRTADGKADALAFAGGVVAQLAQPARAEDPLTIEQLFQRFVDEKSPEWRPNTLRIYQQSWGYWARHVGPHTIAETCTRENCVSLRKYLEQDRDRKLAVNTIRQVFVTVRIVVRWAEDAGLIPPSSILRYSYRVSKDRQPVPPPEYRQDEAVAILAQVTAWRPKLALLIAMQQGARQTAILHLRWSDVDFEARTLTWRAKYDKIGKDRVQPMRKAVWEELALLAATGPSSPWVIPGERDQLAPYTIQSLWAALKRAEEAAGIEHRKGRGGHGLRRLLAGQVAAITGNPKTGTDAIGDGPDQIGRYVQAREDSVRDAFEKLDAPEGAYQSHTAVGEEKPVTSEAQAIQPLTASAPRRNRTYNLPHQLQAGDTVESHLSSGEPPEDTHD
jgi:integrase